MTEGIEKIEELETLDVVDGMGDVELDEYVDDAELLKKGTVTKIRGTDVVVVVVL